jgi:hypothetical protein
MKVGKELHYVTSDYIPEGAIESRTEAVRNGAAVDAHRPEGALHLRLREGSLKGVETRHWGKNTSRVEVPDGGSRCAEQLGVEAVENSGLLIMVEKRTSTIMEHTDLVPTQAG